MISMLKKDELVRGGVLLFFMVALCNLFNYLFQMSMARLLGPIDYGVLAVLISFIYIFSIPCEAIQTVISRYTSKFNIRGDFGKMKDLLYRSLKKGAFISLITFLIFLPIALFFSSFLKIEVWLIILTGASIFYFVTIPIVRGIIQGRKKFVGLGINLIVEALIKVLLAVSLVLIGLKVYGAMMGLLVAIFITFILAFCSIKEITSSQREKADFKKVYSTNFQVLFAITAVVLMYSLDVILARKFFPPRLVGQYAFVSLIGKVVIFSSAAIIKVMFPLSSENFERGKSTSAIFKKSIMIISLLCGVALFFYLFFPVQVIRILSLGSGQYLEAANILFIVGLAFSFISLTNAIIIYNISINRIKKLSFSLLFFVILQVILLSIFNSNLMEFSLSLLFVSFIMLVYSVIITSLKK